MKIRLTVEFEADKGKKFTAAAAIEEAAKSIKIDSAKLITATVAFPTGPKAKISDPIAKKSDNSSK